MSAVTSQLSISLDGYVAGPNQRMQDQIGEGGMGPHQWVLAAGLLDELRLHLVPITLGAGERLLDDVGGLTFEPIEVVASPGVTHLSHRAA